MVHVPAKFPENTSMRFRVTVPKLNVTDGWTDRRGHCNISRPRAYGAAGDKNTKKTLNEKKIYKNYYFFYSQNNFFLEMLEIA